MKNLISFILLVAIVTSSCNKTTAEKIEVKIGTQTWMTENLNVDKFQNGDPIPEVKSQVDWNKASENKQPAWCYYDNNPSNGEKYGKLYNWYAVNDPRGLAPKGWRIPTKTDFLTLTDFLGYESVAGKKMKSSSGWSTVVGGNDDKDLVGTNESGFNGLSGGKRNYIGFDLRSKEGFWWTSSTSELGCVQFVDLNALLDGITYRESISSTNRIEKTQGLSVRCLKN